MKNSLFALAYALALGAALPAAANTECTHYTAHDSEDGPLFDAKGRDVTIEQLKIGSIVIFLNEKYKIVKWEVSGGPETAMVVESLHDRLTRDLTCTDENTSTSDD